MLVYETLLAKRPEFLKRVFNGLSDELMQPKMQPKTALNSTDDSL